jgi:hypothetical protein
VSFGNDTRGLCTLSLAGRLGDNTWICQIGETGGYDCPLVTSDGMPPLRHANGRTDKRGVLTLTVPLTATQPTTPLPWRRRYSHVDGFILPLNPGREAATRPSFLRDRTRSLRLVPRDQSPAIRSPLRRQLARTAVGKRHKHLALPVGRRLIDLVDVGAAARTEDYEIAAYEAAPPRPRVAGAIVRVRWILR